MIVFHALGILAASGCAAMYALDPDLDDAGLFLSLVALGTLIATMPRRLEARS